MATKKKSKQLIDDGDDAHFSDNPAVPKRIRERWQSEDRKQIGASGKGHPAVKVTKKEVPSKKSSFDRVYRRPKAGTKRTQRKKVSVK